MPDISRIKLPSGNVYDIKDAVARQMISGGVSFIIAWDGTNVPDVSTIPEGVVVTYNGRSYTGTLTAEATQEIIVEGQTVTVPGATPGAFYLVRSSTSAGVSDHYDEYVPVGATGSKTWEKIGDTQIDLSDVVTDVGLSKATDTVIGSDATFKMTQPTITLAEDSTNGNVSYVKGGTTKYMSATASGTAVTPSTTNVKATASGTAVGANGTANAVTGYPNATTDTFVKSVSAETGKNLVTTSIVPTNGTESVSKVTKTASKLVTTSITPTNGTESVSKVTQTASKLVQTSIVPTNGTESVSKVTKTASKLVTTTVPNVTDNTDVSVPNITGNSSVTANKSTWTFQMGTATGETETLIIGGGNGSDVSATNTVLGTAKTASKVTLGTAKTVATGAVDENGGGSSVVTGVTISDKTVAKAGSAVTVATGAVSDTGTGSDIVTGVTISDKTVAKAGSAVTVATGSVASTGTGSDIVTAVTISDKTVAKVGTAVTVATGETDEEGTGAAVVTGVTIGSSASALTGLGTPTTAAALTGVKVTAQPTIALAKNATAGTGVISLVDGISSVTQPTIALSAEDSTATGRQKFVQELTTSKIKGTASGAKTEWNSKDTVTVLTNGTNVSVTKGKNE
jgi:hypothetical protein